MASVYTGSGVDANRLSRVQARARSKKRAVKTGTLIKALAVLITLTVAGTCLLVNSARSVNESNALRAEQNRRTAIENKIKTLSFEIQRELMPENLTLNAQMRLGMVRSYSSLMLTALNDAVDSNY